MKKIKRRYIILSLFMMIITVMWVFNISVTSLPTTFSKMLEEQSAGLYYDKIQKIRIEKPHANQVDFVIEDKDEIYSLLNNDLRIYNGGRYNTDSNKYDLYIDFYGSTYRCTIAEGYIITYDGIFKVLDQQNEIFEYIESLYAQN